MASKTVEYRITSASKDIRGPETGLLYTDSSMRRGVLVGNSQRIRINTGINIRVPPGVSVRVEGLYQHRVNGLLVAEYEVFHSEEFMPLICDVWNAANATMQLQPGDPIARITAIPLAAPVRWGEADLIGITPAEEVQSG